MPGHRARRWGGGCRRRRTTRGVARPGPAQSASTALGYRATPLGEDGVDRVLPRPVHVHGHEHDTRGAVEDRHHGVEVGAGDGAVRPQRHHDDGRVARLAAMTWRKDGLAVGPLAAHRRVHVDVRDASLERLLRCRASPSPPRRRHHPPPSPGCTPWAAPHPAPSSSAPPLSWSSAAPSSPWSWSHLEVRPPWSTCPVARRGCRGRGSTRPGPSRPPRGRRRRPPR